MNWFRSAILLVFAASMLASATGAAMSDPQATAPQPPQPAAQDAPATTDQSKPPSAEEKPKPQPSVTKITYRAIVPALIPQTNASHTLVAIPQIQHVDPSLTLPEIISRFVPGASINANNDLRIRGADDQFSTYIDGAPVPDAVSGSITDDFDSKDISKLNIYTAGYPAMYGGELAALYDIDTKSGVGAASATASQSAASASTYVSEGSFEGGAGGLGYFVSASHRQTAFFLNPPTRSSDHDFGHEDHGFMKFDYAPSYGSRITLQIGSNGANFQVPDTPDTQQESGDLANLIWRVGLGKSFTRVVLYSHRSHVIFNGNESVEDQAASGDIDADQNLSATYTGIRLDRSWSGGSKHQFADGFDVSHSTASQDFAIHLPPPPAGPGGDLTDNSNPHAWNTGLYMQDSWTPGRFQAGYGVRYDVSSQDDTKNQVSPRVNLKYNLNGRDTVHAYYDRLFQPVAVQDAVHLVGLSTVGDSGTLDPLLPERDSLYEIGIDHVEPGLSFGVAAYYKTGQDVRDDDEVGNTNIQLPVNDAKAYFRGVEFTVDHDLSPTLHGFGNLALSWNKNAGPVTGGLNEGGFPTQYFYDDHDQTYTATFGLAYEHHGVFGDLTGEYGSGQPYGEIDDDDGTAIAVNYLRVPSHLLFNADLGIGRRTGFGVSLFANNLFNDVYVIKQVTSLSDAQFAQGRVVGIRLSGGL